MPLAERIDRYLAKCEPAISGSGGHVTTLKVASALVHGFALPTSEALRWLTVYNQKCQPPWSRHDLEHKVASAAAKCSKKGRGYLLAPDQIPLDVGPATTPQSVPEPKPQYELAYLQAYAEQLSDTVDETYLEIRSQFSSHNRSPAGFLHKIFRPGESVWITTNDKSSEGLIWTHQGPGQNLAELDQLRRGHLGVWYLSNPIDGRLHRVERLVSERNRDGLSFRCTECVTDWRHGVLETDEAPPELWLKALVRLELPILAIYHSGKRGPHALFRLGAASHDHWNELLQPHRRHVIRLGACPGTLTPLRLSRLPNCVRGQTGHLQQLLYLAPDADNTPICQRPSREAEQGSRLRWSRAHQLQPPL
jgi:hypothetical protein